MSEQLTVCTANISRGTTGFKRLLLPPSKRYKRALQFFREQDVDLVGGQEFADKAARTFIQAPDYGVLQADPNNVFANDSLRNVILHETSFLKKIDSVNINTDMRGRKLGLNFPVGLYENRSTRQTFAAICIHNPSAKTDVKARNEALNAQLEYISKCWLAGIPVIILGDFNQGNPEDWFRKELRVKVGVEEHVDHIMGVGFNFTHPEIHKEAGVRGRGGFSDHPVLIVKAQPKVVCTIQILPKVPAANR